MFVFTQKLQKRVMHSYNVTVFSAFLTNSKSGFNLICISALQIQLCSNIYLSLSLYIVYPSQCRTYTLPPGNYNPNASGSDAYRGSHTTKQNTRTYLPEFVVSREFARINTTYNRYKGENPVPDPAEPLRLAERKGL